MPRIRKKTSRRGTTNQREKIKHKAAETRKKRKKEAKTNTQWKSKHKKDPGIPNNFPYKDQILAEVVEKRRQAEEAKQLRKEQKKALKAASGATADDVDGEGSEGSEGEEDVGGYVGVSAVRAAGSSKEKLLAKDEKATPEAEAEDIEAIDSRFSSLTEVLQGADVVVEVLDARDPLAYHSQHLAELVKAKEGQKFLLVLYKIDTVPREALSSWLTHFRAHYPTHPTLLFRSATSFLPSVEPISSGQSKGKGKARADDAQGIDGIFSLLRRWADEKTGDEPLTVAVVGYTNSGKSSLVNSLLHKAVVPVYQVNSSSLNDGPSTTLRAQEVTVDVEGKKITVIDTPGYSWQSFSAQSEQESAEVVRARDILVRNKGRIERLKDPEPVVHDIVTRANQEDLMLFYNLPAFARDDTDAFLRALAKASGLVKKGGVLDIAGASRVVLRDWSTGKFPRYTVFNGTREDSATKSGDSGVASLYEAQEKLLGTLHSKKEMRTTSGLVKMRPLDVEGRRLNVDEKWGKVEDSDAEDEGEDEGEEGDEDETGDDEDEEDDGEDDEDEVPEPVSSKRKRSLAKDAATPRPKKKVAFSAEPKNTKQARKVAGARGSSLAKAKPALDAQPAVVGKKVKKAANAPSKKTAAVPTTAGGDEYDFGKFF